MNRFQHAGAALSLSSCIALCGVSAGAASPAPNPLGVRPLRGAVFARSGPANSPVTSRLHHIITIGSTVDPLNGDQNPYGLAISPVNSGKFQAGDLVICNFNDGLNIQGLGTTMDVLHPIPGSKPMRVVADDRLEGCAALALDADDADPWVAAYTANDNPVLDSLGDFEPGPPQRHLALPWGQALADTRGPYGIAAFYETNAQDGTIVRFAIKGRSNNLHHPRYTTRVIASGFSVNHGVPGAILAPSGLTYDPSNDTLYIVDGNVNRVVAFHDISLIPPDGIVVKGNSFGGPAASSAEVIFRGAPLADPISAALLFNGNIVVGNTANNRLLEINPATHAVVHVVDLDKGPAGALFGIAATGSNAASTQIFFNDDNDNTVKVLER